VGIPEEVGKATTSAVDAMRGTPILLAIIIVVIGFLGFNVYLMGEVAANSKERNIAQLALINSLVKDIRDCRAAAEAPNSYDPITKSLMRIR